MFNSEISIILVSSYLNQKTLEAFIKKLDSLCGIQELESVILPLMIKSK